MTTCEVMDVKYGMAKKLKDLCKEYQFQYDKAIEHKNYELAKYFKGMRDGITECFWKVITD